MVSLLTPHFLRAGRGQHFHLEFASCRAIHVVVKRQASVFDIHVWADKPYGVIFFVFNWGLDVKIVTWKGRWGVEFRKGIYPHLFKSADEL